LALTAAIPSSHAFGRSEETHERWYAVVFQGMRAGWMHEQSITQNGRISSNVDTHISIKRGPIAITIETNSRFIEGTDGVPYLISSTQKLAGQAMTKTVEFKPDGPVFTATVGGQTQSQPLNDLDDDWLMPAAAARYIEERMAAGETTITYKSFDPSVTTKPFAVTHTTLGRENIELLGRIAPAIKRTTSVSIMPGIKTTEHINDKGENLKTAIDFGGLSMEIVATDKQLALSEIEAPELMASTFVRSKTAIPDPRKIRKTRFRLTTTVNELPELPNTTYQLFERINERHGILTVDLDARTPSRAEAPPVTNTPMIDGRDPRIIALVRDNGFDKIKSVAERSEAIRRFAHAYMTNADLSVGMASASEVVQTRQGDCSEFGVLCAAMLRAARPR
jgi:hypothetical protein